MSNPILSNGVRQNLLSLQTTSRAAEQTQLRLATGRKVNTAIDNPVNYFTSAQLNSRSELLSGLLDGISNGVQAITSASSGIDAIVKLVQSAQATIRQALNEAAQNRPSKTGAALANAAEITAANKSAADVTLGKKIQEASAGAGAVAASSTTDGSLGIAANSTVTLSAGNTTYSFATTSAMTVRDLVSEINKSGIANAGVDASGKFTVSGSGSDPLKFNVQGAAAGDGLDNLGFASADIASFTGTGVAVAANSAVRTSLIDQYNTLRTQIDKLATDAGYNGTNLLQGNLLRIVFNEKTGSSRNVIDVQGFSVSASTLGMQAAGNGATPGEINFQNDVDLANADQSLMGAIATLRSMSSSLGANLTVVQIRQDFTKSMMTTLRSGADNLVLADSNEEGANLLALQTRQQLSQTALSLASQADQSVLRLFS